MNAIVLFAIVLLLVLVVVAVATWAQSAQRVPTPSTTVICNGVVPSETASYDRGREPAKEEKNDTKPNASVLVGGAMAKSASAHFSPEQKHNFCANLFATPAEFLGRVGMAQAQLVVNGANCELPDGRKFDRTNFAALKCVIPGCTRNGVHGLTTL